MAAIKSKRPPLTNAPKAVSIGPKGGQPPSFRATGMGYFNKLPRFPADEKIANAFLKNKAVQASDRLHKIYLFVDAVETGWKLTGETTQTQGSRSFYPRNMSQDEVTIQGTMPNQYEFDRLAEFVKHHQNSQFSSFAMSTDTFDGMRNYPGCAFALFRPQSGQALNTHAPLHYTLVVTEMQAGTERFKNFPTYELTCKVVFDHLESSNNDQTDIGRDLDYWTKIKQVYGDVKTPAMTQGKDTKTTSQSAAPQQTSNPAKSEHNHPA